MRLPRRQTLILNQHLQLNLRRLALPNLLPCRNLT
jgi:hypothetical protein